MAEAVLEITDEGMMLEITDEGTMLEITDEGTMLEITEVTLEIDVAIDTGPVRGKVVDIVATDVEAEDEATLDWTFDVGAFEFLIGVVLAIGEETVELVTADEDTGKDDVNTVVDEVRMVEAVFALDTEDEAGTEDDEAGTEDEETARVEVDTTLVARLEDPVATLETTVVLVAELTTCDVLAATDDVARLDDWATVD